MRNNITNFIIFYREKTSTLIWLFMDLYFVITIFYTVFIKRLKY